ncbi:GerMN domain-containing protein [Nocardioides pinisoli]|uniref:GerMN domain-containing protein n=1 Tax=Nocardioides pinisoli TaxID=2950279 RepID=A0ABT1KZG4_9ACTN|nr:GerMN domain-containing protein [Nocardioides pinisoli]MCP3423170.1 GerMN domain-containing protein [Nocardioides pinisoli]
MLNRLRARVAAALLAATVLLTAGCGVPLQDDPALLQQSPAPPVPTSAPSGMNAVRVYLIRDGRLEPVTRTSDNTSARSLVELLIEGPTAAEEAAGATTAVAPGEFQVDQAPSWRSPGVSVTINVPVQFTQIDGDLQLLATAQLVWTATELRPRGLVRMTFNGEPIELPTDRGLTSGAVRRSDFFSVAPRGARLESADPE